MCTCTHKHVCRHTYRHTQIHAHAYVLTLSPGAGAPPDSLEDPPLYHLGWTSAAFLPQDLLLVAATCLCAPCVCVCVCARAPHRRMSRCLRQQGREDHQCAEVLPQVPKPAPGTQ